MVEGGNRERGGKHHLVLIGVGTLVSVRWDVSLVRG